MAAILEVNNIEVIYNNVVLVLKGLSLAVEEGAIVSLLGSNGAGKSTTLKAISGLLPLEDGEITEGTIDYQGRSLTGLAPHRIVRQGIFQIMEGRRVFEDLTVEENLACETTRKTTSSRSMKWRVWDARWRRRNRAVSNPRFARARPKTCVS